MIAFVLQILAWLWLIGGTVHFINNVFPTRKDNNTLPFWISTVFVALCHLIAIIVVYMTRGEVLVF